MAWAGVAHFERRFRHVELTRSQQLSRFLHPKLPQVLRDGLAGLTGKNPAQIKMTAPDFASEFLERRRFRQVLFQEKDDLLDAFLGDALLAGAEQFILRRWLDQERDGQLERFALIPDRLRTGIDRWLAQRGYDLLLAGGQFGRGP